MVPPLALIDKKSAHGALGASQQVWPSSGRIVRWSVRVVAAGGCDATGHAREGGAYLVPCALGLHANLECVEPTDGGLSYSGRGALGSASREPGRVVL
jgi:hypothetical protein